MAKHVENCPHCYSSDIDWQGDGMFSFAVWFGCADCEMRGPAVRGRFDRKEQSIEQARQYWNDLKR